MGSNVESSVTTEDSKEKGFDCLEILPEEMWRELLKKLGDDEDINTLLKCRGVCHELKFIAEEELADQAAWEFTDKNYLYQGETLVRHENYRRSDQRLFVKITRGTHITKTEDVRKFFVSKDIVTVGNHFPNGCVLFYPGEGLTYPLAFYNSLETLVNTFPDAISTFVYQPHFSLDTTQFLLQLSLIFQLKNLKRLFIYYSHEPNQPQKFELGTLNKAFKSFNIKTTHTNRLQNLHLREYPPNNDKSPLITLFKNFLPEWKNLEYLNFNWSCSIDMGEITRQMMEHPPPRKLEQLELQDPSQQLLEYFCVDSVDKEGLRPAKYSPRYKEIHIHFNNGGNRFATQVQGYSKEESNVIQLFNTLDANQTDLETLTLGLYLPPNFQRRPGPLPLNFAVKFTKLTELHLNYIILLRWESLLEMLNEKLPNIEKITVESSYECMKIFNESNVKIVGVYHTVRNLWNVFPSLKTIRVLYYQWTLEKGGKDPENVTRVAKRL